MMPTAVVASMGHGWMEIDGSWFLVLLSTAVCGDISQSYSRWMESIAS